VENNVIGGIDSLIAFHNSRGVPGRGTVLHLSRTLVVFEVYNPYSIVQMSEVLKNLQILRGERVLYSGRAVISNIVATGLMVIVSATLVDNWSDLAGLKPGEGLREEVQSFVQKWETTNTIRPKFQVSIGRLRGFLADLNRWLEQVEIASDAKNVNQHQEFCQELEQPLTPKITELFQSFEHEANQLALEELDAHRSYTRRELHPLTLCAPFVHRSFTKPLGYAGDYQMVNMMLQTPIEGSSTYAKIVNTWCLRQGAPAAHRNRIDMLVEILRNESKRVFNDGRLLRIMNIGCGPAVEIQEFLRDDPLSDRCDFTLMDFNEETIAYADSRLKEASQRHNRSTKIKFMHKSVDDLLKEVAGLRETLPPNSFDLVYCAGLFDYLSDRTCKRLMQHFYNWAAPGGLVVATNVHMNNPVRQFMEHLMEWHLIYRDESRMAALTPVPGVVRCDITGINVFVEARKNA
jgi:extracellular factor (EF) 3-hydroxypalmitic acid methyl ester biosynthesis protein